jgi:hypothetical protein
MGAPKNYSTRSLTAEDQPEIDAVLAANPGWKLKHARENVARKLTGIARQHLDLETLETRNSDSLDFHDLAVWGIRAAGQEAR